MVKAIFNWSGGKDSALALYKIRQHKNIEVLSLLTSVSLPFRRISMHGVREELLDLQAERIGLPLKKMILSEMPDMQTYEKETKLVLSELSGLGADTAIFGDIYLEDLRRYREEQLAKSGWKALFPLWKNDTRTLMKEFLELGFKTVVVAVNEKFLDKSFAGRIIDEQFLSDLPAAVDPCGENGEYHTFVFDGPIFSEPLHVRKGELVFRKYSSASGAARDQDPFAHGFWFCDLLPVGQP